MKRLEALRCAAMKRTHSNDEFYYRFYKRYHKNEGMEEYARYADAFAAAFGALTPVIAPDELIVGTIENTLSDAEKLDWEDVYRPVAQERARRAGPGQDSHMAIDYPLLLSKGALGIVSRIDALCEQANAEQRAFYLAARECLLSVNALPKYGNNVDEVDELFTGLIDHIVKECQKYTPMHANGRLIPSVFCWVMHERFGRETGATPDGRRAGFPLGDGSDPCQGREKNGPTASILSSTKWEHYELIGGVAVNMKFSRSSMGANSIDVMKALIRAYMTRGGFEMQINVIDRALLERAQKESDAYGDLVVRIGGYSDYFTRLSSQMQAEVIQRTEHRI